MISPHQAKYFAYDLTRRFAPDSVEKLAGVVASAQVDLNPHNKVHRSEEVFHRLMFDVGNFESLE